LEIGVTENAGLNEESSLEIGRTKEHARLVHFRWFLEIGVTENWRFLSRLVLGDR
jgi:hypothetical protein